MLRGAALPATVPGNAHHTKSYVVSSVSQGRLCMSKSRSPQVQGENTQSLEHPNPEGRSTEAATLTEKTSFLAQQAGHPSLMRLRGLGWGASSRARCSCATAQQLRAAGGGGGGGGAAGSPRSDEPWAKGVRSSGTPAARLPTCPPEAPATPMLPRPPLHAALLAAATKPLRFP